MGGSRLKIYIAFLALVATISSCSDNHKQKRREVNPDCVYVCSGHSAKRYHSISDCKGLRKCSGEILEMTVAEAEGKTPCRMCVKR